MKLRSLVSIPLAAVALAGCASTPSRREWVLHGFDPTCGEYPEFAAAARSNAESLDALEWAPFGAPEQGWRIYAPAIAAEIRTRCTPDSAEFASKLARWQSMNGTTSDGRIQPPVFDRMKTVWQARRRFLALRARGVCPAAPDEAALSPVPATAAVWGKTVLVAPQTLASFERMLSAARRDLGMMPEDETLTVFSGYRSPQYDAARCEQEQNCQGVVRAECSAHRTGLALDLVLTPARGYPVDATASPNRLFQTQSPAYRWLVVNASRYGFVNYVFEPWHWEWVGETP